jgi:hypothetical protein
MKMKKLTVVALLACVIASGTVMAQTSVGVSIGINQPGVYGRINIGNFPQPVLVLPQPVVIVAAPVAVQREPIYLYVPPGHQKNWAKHCYKYNACGQPVYFVQEQWVRDRYEEENPQWREEGGKHGRGHGKGGEHRGKKDKD